MKIFRRSGAGRLACCAGMLVMSLSLAFIFVAFGSLEVGAAPANPHPFTGVQADGEEIVLFFRGDEFFAWWEDYFGFVVAFDAASGNWRYANVVDGVIAPVGGIVGRDDGGVRIDRGALLPLIQNGWRFDPGNPLLEFFDGRLFRDHRGTAAVLMNVPTVPSIMRTEGVAAPSIPNLLNVILPGTMPEERPTIIIRPPVIPPGHGDDGPAILGSLAQPRMSPAAPVIPAAMTNQRLLVLLIEFDNMPLLRDSAFYHNKYFNTTPGALSVANYFRDMAGGRDVFIPAGNVMDGGTVNARWQGSGLGWAENGVYVTITPSTHNGIVHARLHMNHPVNAWGAPSGHEAVRAVVSVVLAAIHQQNGDFNFGGIHVAAVVAGGEASDHNYNPGGQIWAHAWQYAGALVGGSGWPRYMAYGERMREGQVMGIGVAAHELGHVLGLPDLYDVTGQSEGVGPYSLMAFGSWGRAAGDPAAGHRPTALDPWSRKQLGFIQPVIVDGQWRGNVNAMGNAGHNVLLITSPVDAQQFFMVENRQVGGTWDVGLENWIRNTNARGGIVVYHIDESMRSSNPADMTRNNNNRNRMLVNVKEADGGSLLLSAVARWMDNIDHFFAGDAFNIFGPDTSPNSNFHTGAGRNASTGVEIVVHGQRGAVMEVEVSR